MYREHSHLEEWAALLDTGLAEDLIEEVRDERRPADGVDLLDPDEAS